MAKKTKTFQWEYTTQIPRFGQMSRDERILALNVKVRNLEDLIGSRIRLENSVIPTIFRVLVER